MSNIWPGWKFLKTTCIFQKCVEKFGHIVDTFWTHYGHILDTFWTYQVTLDTIHEDVQNMSKSLDTLWTFDMTMDTFWTRFGQILELDIFWSHFGHILDIFWTLPNS